MRYHRRQRMRLGLVTGLLAFCAGWAVIALLAPQEVFDAPRWQNTLWMYLGANTVELNQGILSQESVQPVNVADLPEYVYLLPILGVGIASSYICSEIQSGRVKHNMSNSMAAGASYFLTALVAMVISDIQPGISFLLIIALVAGGGLWIGSTLIGALSRGIPFLGIASLGTVVAIGIVVILGSVAVLSVIQGLVVVSFAPAMVVGAGFGISRRLERRGRRSDYPRIAGLRDLLEDSWKETLVTVLVLVGLIIGLNGGI